MGCGRGVGAVGGLRRWGAGMAGREWGEADACGIARKQGHQGVKPPFCSGESSSRASKRGMTVTRAGRWFVPD